MKHLFFTAFSVDYASGFVFSPAEGGGKHIIFRKLKWNCCSQTGRLPLIKSSVFVAGQIIPESMLLRFRHCGGIPSTLPCRGATPRTGRTPCRPQHYFNPRPPRAGGATRTSSPFSVLEGYHRSAEVEHPKWNRMIRRITGCLKCADMIRNLRKKRLSGPTRSA